MVAPAMSTHYLITKNDAAKMVALVTATTYLSIKLFTTINPISALTFVGVSGLLIVIANINLISHRIFNEIIKFLFDIATFPIAWLAANYYAKFTIIDCFTTGGLTFLSGLIVVLICMIFTNMFDNVYFTSP